MEFQLKLSPLKDESSNIIITFEDIRMTGTWSIEEIEVAIKFIKQNISALQGFRAGIAYQKQTTRN